MFVTTHRIIGIDYSWNCASPPHQALHSDAFPIPLCPPPNITPSTHPAGPTHTEYSAQLHSTASSGLSDNLPATVLDLSHEAVAALQEFSTQKEKWCGLHDQPDTAVNRPVLRPNQHLYSCPDNYKFRSRHHIKCLMHKYLNSDFLSTALMMPLTTAL